MESTGARLAALPPRLDQPIRGPWSAQKGATGRGARYRRQMASPLDGLPESADSCSLTSRPDPGAYACVHNPAPAATVLVLGGGRCQHRRLLRPRYQLAAVRHRRCCPGPENLLRSGRVVALQQVEGVEHCPRPDGKSRLVWQALRIRAASPRDRLWATGRCADSVARRRPRSLSRRRWHAPWAFPIRPRARSIGQDAADAVDRLQRTANELPPARLRQPRLRDQGVSSGHL
jgi:hypothetical protein